jgi:hypothetical protein
MPHRKIILKEEKVNTTSYEVVYLQDGIEPTFSLRFSYFFDGKKYWLGRRKYGSSSIKNIGKVDTEELALERLYELAKETAETLQEEHGVKSIENRVENPPKIR